ncbi:MAG: hypothetical protein KBS77_07445 [Bacteroidales bacterium]|nr:hypothetical protein [Candidatus Colicola faecequi]
MNIFVNTYNIIEGFHRWADAPDDCAYLRARHRHMFTIRCAFKVTDENREIEINKCQNEIESFLGNLFGIPMELGGMSCEHLAHVLMNEYGNLSEVTILEDNYGGATLSR